MITESKGKVSSTFGEDFSNETPILSSTQKPWSGIEIEYWRHNPRELVLPALPNHLISLALEGPHRLRQERDGRVHEGLHLPGNINLIPAGQESRWQWNKSNSCLRINIESQFLENVAQVSELANKSIELKNRFSIRDTNLEQIGNLLLAELKSEGLGGKLYVDSLCNVLAIHLLRNYSTFERQPRRLTGGLSRSALQQVIEYIMENLETELALADLATVANLSPSHFARLFKQSTGIPPHQYVIQRRVEAAKGLLIQGKSSVSEIAYRVGFANPSHLSYHFKRIIGVMPKALLQDSKNLLEESQNLKDEVG